jgi:hypothetical protein
MDSFTILFGHFIKLSLKYENNLNPSCACAPLPLVPASPLRRILRRRRAQSKLVSFFYTTKISLIYDVYFSLSL